MAKCKALTGSAVKGLRCKRKTLKTGSFVHLRRHVLFYVVPCVAEVKDLRGKVWRLCDELEELTEHCRHERDSAAASDVGDDGCIRHCTSFCALPHRQVFTLEHLITRLTF